MEEDVKFDLSAIDNTFKRYKTGEIVTSKIVSENSDGIIVNIGGKKDGYIKLDDQEREAFKNFDMTSTFDTVITSVQNDDGVIYVSKARADALREGNTLLGSLSIGDNVKFIVTQTNNSGLISNVGSYRLFVPFSQISNKRVDNNLNNYINKQLIGTILEIDKEDKKVVASVKTYERQDQLSQEQAFWEAIFINKVVKGKVVRFTDFGAFVNIGGVDCLVHNNEASYDRDKKASEILELNKEYNFRVINVDKDAKRVSLSYKALQENPLLPKLQKLNVGDTFMCEVTKILPSFAIVKFGEGLEGRLGAKDISYDFSKKISDVVHVGDKIELKLINVDLEKLRVDLSLIAMMATEYTDTID